MLLAGAAAASGAVESYVVDTLLLGVGAAGTAAAVVWGDAWGAVVTVVGQALGAADDRVNDLLFRQVFFKTQRRRRAPKPRRPWSRDTRLAKTPLAHAAEFKEHLFFFNRALFGI